MILSFRTGWSGQILQTQIRLLLEEQSDQDLHHLQYCLHFLDALLLNGKASFFQFWDDYCKFSSAPKFRNFTEGANLGLLLYIDVDISFSCIPDMLIKCFV